MDTDISQIGQQHGKQAKDKVHGSIAFYETLFKKTTKLDWAQVRSLAMDFEPVIKEKWPAYLAEMQGMDQPSGLLDHADVHQDWQKEQGLSSPTSWH